MKQHITAPAPRMLLRLIELKRSLGKLDLLGSQQNRFCEIGPGLGDATSLAIELFTIEKADLFEDAADARTILQQRFSTHPYVTIEDTFTRQPNSYDMVMCFEVIEHIDDDRLFLNEIYSSLDSGGHFLGSVPAYMSKWQDVDELAGHYRRYESAELHEKLSTAGFVDISVHCYGFPLINLLYPLRKIYYSTLLKKSNSTSKSASTAKSGISRGLARSFNTSLVLNIVRFFSIFQSIPILNRLGDGFVFSCRKP